MFVVSSPWDADYLVLTGNARLVRSHEAKLLDACILILYYLFVHFQVITSLRFITAQEELQHTDQLFGLWTQVINPQQ